ncbi:MAG: CDP-alcohol phosphatidyltransferase family protein, partial [Myxococcales bacterium]|nr:CDP-alcohol phosphatidyltransferase family protein [Myxococcales bacterium]
MATLEPQALTSEGSGGAPTQPEIAGPRGWKRRLEDPFNTFYRYPVALAITRLLMGTRVTPNQVSLVQPVFAAGAGYLLT